MHSSLFVTATSIIPMPSLLAISPSLHTCLQPIGNTWLRSLLEISACCWSFENPLSMTITAGIEGLPTLLKLANVMAAKKAEWQAMKHLPIPVELGKEYQFHSIFVCPVSREQGSEENLPMLLPCLHVLCKQSITKLSKGSSGIFKCPYCPAEASVAQCRQLYF